MAPTVKKAKLEVCDWQGFEDPTVLLQFGITWDLLPFFFFCSGFF
jgi:hypothetical protein